MKKIPNEKKRKNEINLAAVHRKKKTFNTISFQQPLGRPYLQRNSIKTHPNSTSHKNTYLLEFLASMVWEFIFIVVVCLFVF